MKIRIKNVVPVILLVGLVLFSGNAMAQQDDPIQQSDPGTENQGLVDTNGNGQHDDKPEFTGDGIPNNQQPEFDGVKKRNGFGKGGFIDEDGDGMNDNAEDADGDGIPNGQDPDYVKPCDGSGKKEGNGLRGQASGNGQRGRGQGSGRK